MPRKEERQEPSWQSPRLIFRNMDIGAQAWGSEADHAWELGVFPNTASFSSGISPARIQAEKGLGVTRAPEECKARNSAQQRPLSLTQLRKNPD